MVGDPAIVQAEPVKAQQTVEKTARQKTTQIR
jgi:hypothetical protein